MEDRICHRILSRRCVGPELFHEEHLVGEGRHYTCAKEAGSRSESNAESTSQVICQVLPPGLARAAQPQQRGPSLKGLEGSRRAVRDPKGRKVTVTIFRWSCFLYPVRQVSHKVKEEIALGHTDDLGAQHMVTKAEEAARGHRQGWLLPHLLQFLLTALSQLDFSATNC